MSADREDGTAGEGDVVVRKAEHGWVVGGENVSDLTSAMVLADLFASDEAGGTETGQAAADGGKDTGRQSVRPPAPRAAMSGPQRSPFAGAAGESSEAERLAVTVTQLEHALASRVRVEQAIGVLAERHRLQPREAFDVLRHAARTRGQRVADLAQDVVASAANPLLRLPEELARKLPEPRPRGRSLRRRRPAAGF